MIQFADHVRTRLISQLIKGTAISAIIIPAFSVLLLILIQI